MQFIDNYLVIMNRKYIPEHLAQSSTLCSRLFYIVFDIKTSVDCNFNIVLNIKCKITGAFQFYIYHSHEKKKPSYNPQCIYTFSLILENSVHKHLGTEYMQIGYTYNISQSAMNALYCMLLQLIRLNIFTFKRQNISCWILVFTM